jgi:hypothetical protein
MASSQAGVGLLERYGLTPLELAILEMTNDATVRVSRKSKPRLTILTSKEAYFWAAFIAFLAESTAVEPDALARVTELALLRALRSHEADRRERFKMRRTIFEAGLFAGEEFLIYHDIVSGLQIQDGGGFRSFLGSALSGYSSLERKGLIEDPPIVLVSGVATLVLGMVPVSFTKKTKNGKVVSRRIKALWWKWEKAERAGTVQTSLEFRVLKLLRAFRSGFGAVLDEPDES